MTDRRLLGRRWRAPGLVLIFLLIACEGGDPVAGPAGGESAQTDPTAAATPAGERPGDPVAPSGDAEMVDVNRTIWNYGFEWEILEAALYDELHTDRLGQDYRNLIVKVRLTNLATAPGGLNREAAAICARGERQLVATTRTVHLDDPISEVPSGETVEGELHFAVDPCFDLEHGFLVLGPPGDNQAAVPFGPSGPPMRDLAPFGVVSVGEISMEMFDLVVTEVRVTADRVERHQALPRGERTMYVYFDFSHRRPGPSSLPPPSFELRLPDGSVEAPANWGPDFARLPPQTVHSLWLRFPLPSEEVAGEYSLTFTPGRHSFQGTDEEDAHTLTFTLSP